MIYTQEQIMIELVKRMTDEALEFSIALGHTVTFNEFEEKWKQSYPNRSIFISKQSK